MDRKHFVSTMPLYVYVSLKKWLYFSIFVSIILVLSFCIVELPVVWEWLDKKSLYHAQKNIYAQVQELVAQEQSLEKIITQLKENKRIFTLDQELITDFLPRLLENDEGIAVVSIKKNNNAFVIEGTSNQIETITTGLKNVGLKIGYTFRVQSVEHKNKVYFFTARCYKKNNHKNK